jgi:hypothetical protein
VVGRRECKERYKKFGQLLVKELYMKILIAQPVIEKQMKQLIEDVRTYSDVDMFLYPEGYLQENLEMACLLAGDNQKILITGYKKPKDRAVVIARDGVTLLDRAKYDNPKVIQIEDLRIGYLLCDELVLQGLETSNNSINLIVHPIGVGMFSEEQFSEWIGFAKELARKHRSVMIGTSHADGSFNNCGISIPISYCINHDGQEVFIMKNDTRSVLLDLETLEFEVLEAV